MLLRRYLYCLAIFLCSINVYAQELNDTLLLSKSKRPLILSKKNRDNVPLLISKLTSGASDDKEKFDAIFSWVVTNVEYSMNNFYSPVNSGPEEISNILKTKKTICLGYAQLMDTLCRLAGLENMVVYGYAKDRFYDVNDTIYGHNHAWNAVKLNGLWYLYDATWSNGGWETSYTRRTKWVLKLQKKFPQRFKKKRVKLPRRMRQKGECNEKLKTVYYYKQRFWNRLIRAWLQNIPINFHQKYRKKISSKFYLSEPKIFAATHVPDDPVWSLTDQKTCPEFERDSLFYYLNDSILVNQNREGEICPTCDSIYMADTENRYRILRSHSLKFNSNNRFITSYCDEELGKMSIAASINANTGELLFADSAVSFFNKSVSEITMAKVKMGQYFKGEKRKNGTKTKLLLAENKQHQAFFKSKMNVTYHHQKQLRELINKASAFATVYRNQKEKFEHFRIDFDPSRVQPYSDKRISDLQNAYQRKIVMRDSLVINIKKWAEDYDSVIVSLTLNIWPQVFMHDSILKPFQKCISARMNFMDNYKKKVVDLRRGIPDLERIYNHNIFHILYDRATKCVTLFNAITKAIALKNSLNRDLLKLKLELAKAKEVATYDLVQFRDEIVLSTSEDYCWLRKNYADEFSTLRGFYALRDKQNLGLKIVLLENVIERKRQSIINRSLQNGYRASVKDLSQHTRLLKRKQKEITKNRNMLVNPLKFDYAKYQKSVERIEKLFRERDTY